MYFTGKFKKVPDLTFSSLVFLTIESINNSVMQSISMENVPGILDSKKGHDNYIKTVGASLIGFGMNVDIFAIDSTRYDLSISVFVCDI